MQVTAVIVALLAATPFVAAAPNTQQTKRDLHTRLICLDYRSSVIVGESTAATADGATIAACNAYKRRNTGTNMWDTCPDCTVIQHNEIKACQSLAGHLGGDEFNYYCKQNGANASA